MFHRVGNLIRYWNPCSGAKREKLSAWWWAFAYILWTPPLKIKLCMCRYALDSANKFWWCPFGFASVVLHCCFLRSSFCMLPFLLQAACRIQSAIFQIYRKSQEHAEKFRNLQMASVSKNAYIKRRLTICYLQNAGICTKAPSNKMGAGGARAARRIRI